MVPLFPSSLVGTATWIMTKDAIVTGVEIAGKVLDPNTNEMKKADSSALCFIPTPIPQMKMRRFMVVVEYAARAGDAAFILELRHQKNGGPSKRKVTDSRIPLLCKDQTRGRFGFVLDQEDLEKGGMFCCTAVITPVDMDTLLIPGCWIHIDD